MENEEYEDDAMFSEYIGQEQIKKRLEVAVNSSLIRGTAFPHTLFAGPAGLGKSTLAKLIAKETACKFYSYLATNIEGEKQISAIFSKLDKNGYDFKTGEVTDRKKVYPAIIFIDEIHNLKKKTMEMLHHALEGRTLTISMKNHVTGITRPTKVWIPEFCMIGATNYLGSLPKPFRDRFQINVLFEIYNDDEIFKILKNLGEKEEFPIDDEASRNIASKSRGVPRVAISFFNKSRDIAISIGNGKNITKENVELMFEYEEIDHKGLTRQDRKALKYLATVTRPIGLKALAQAIDEDVQTVENVLEPYLVQLGFLVRTGAGRYLTDEGKNHIQQERNMVLYPVAE